MFYLCRQTKLRGTPQCEILVWNCEKKSLKCLVLSVSIMTLNCLQNLARLGLECGQTKRPIVLCLENGDFNIILRSSFLVARNICPKHTFYRGDFCSIRKHKYSVTCHCPKYNQILTPTEEECIFFIKS